MKDQKDIGQLVKLPLADIDFFPIKVSLNRDRLEVKLAQSVTKQEQVQGMNMLETLYLKMKGMHEFML